MLYGKWQTVRELGRGGQGVVHLAHDTTEVPLSKKIFPAITESIRFMHGHHREDDYNDKAADLVGNIKKCLEVGTPGNYVALKVLHEHVRKDEKAKARFAREVEVLQTEAHPTIVRIIDSSVEDGWFVTPYYPKGPLSANQRMFAGKPLQALEAFRSIVEAVGHLHEKSIVHRDIKPENIFVSDAGLVLGDLGIAYVKDGTTTRVSEAYENVGSRDWMPGWAMGIRLDAVTPAFDVFGLGKVLWAMVSGKTKLQLWYHDRPEFDVRQLFPHDPDVHFISRILGHCVVENERDCLSDARKLLDLVTRDLQRVRRGGQLAQKDVLRTCVVCGYGIYEFLGDQKQNSVTISNLGLNPGMNLRVYRCSYCGHIDIFMMEPNPKSWNEPAQ